MQWKDGWAQARCVIRWEARVGDHGPCRPRVSATKGTRLARAVSGLTTVTEAKAIVVHRAAHPRGTLRNATRTRCPSPRLSAPPPLSGPRGFPASQKEEGRQGWELDAQNWPRTRPSGPRQLGLRGEGAPGPTAGRPSACPCPRRPGRSYFPLDFPVEWVLQSVLFSTEAFYLHVCVPSPGRDPGLALVCSSCSSWPAMPAAAVSGRCSLHPHGWLCRVLLLRLCSGTGRGCGGRGRTGSPRRDEP